MRQPVFDASSGRLRICDAHLSALLALAQGVPEEVLHVDDVTSLRAAGLLSLLSDPTGATVTGGSAVVSGGRELVAAALAGINNAQFYVEVSTRGARGQLLHRVWVGEGVASVVAHVGGDVFDVFPTRATLVVATVARLVGLSPRRVLPAGLVEVSDDVVAGLSSSVTDRGGAVDRIAGVAPAGWADMLADLRAGRFRLHGLAGLWVGPGGVPAGRRLSVLDTPHGLVEVVDAGGRSALRPVRSTDVWIQLVELVPSDSELAADSDLAPVVKPFGVDRA